MFFGTKLNKISINVNNSTMKSSDSVKLLGIDIDNKLSFRQHIIFVIELINTLVAFTELERP